MLYPTFTSVMGGVYTVLNVIGVYEIIGGLNSDCPFTLYIDVRLPSRL